MIKKKEIDPIIVIVKNVPQNKNIVEERVIIRIEIEMIVFINKIVKNVLSKIIRRGIMRMRIKRNGRKDNAMRIILVIEIMRRRWNIKKEGRKDIVTRIVRVTEMMRRRSTKK